MSRETANAPQTVTVTSSLAEIISLDTKALVDLIGIEIVNTGSTALSDLQIQIRFNSANSYHAVIVVADWTAILAGTQSLSNFLTALGTANPGTLTGSNAFAWFIINPQGIESISIKAQTASGSTSLSVATCQTVTT